MENYIFSSKMSALWGAVFCVVVVMCNLTSCKDEEEINWDYQEISVSRLYLEGGVGEGEVHADGNVDYTVSSSRLTIRSSGNLRHQKLMVAADYGVVGGELEHAEGEQSVRIDFDKPFEKYLVKLYVYGKDDNGNVSRTTDTLTTHVYYVPDVYLSLSRRFGEGEDATILKWDTKFYDVDYERYAMNSFSCQKTEISIPDDIRKQFRLTIDMSSEETLCEAKPMEFDMSVDSAYIKKDVDNGIFGTHHSVYGNINGASTYLYEDAYKYNFKATLKIPVGDSIIEKTDTIESILIDGNAFAIDDELNIYNTIKIGDDIWTIDNYRGTKVKYDVPADAQYANEGFYLYREEYEEGHVNRKAFDMIDKHIINGYHVSTEEDWERLESYLGMEYQVKNNSDGKPSYYATRLKWTDIDQVLNCEDTSKYAYYFASNIPWHVFDPDDGYADVETMSKYPFSFQVHYAGVKIYDNDDVKVYRDAAIFAVRGQCGRIVSKKYQSIGRSVGYLWGNVRLVKDRK